MRAARSALRPAFAAALLLLSGCQTILSSNLAERDANEELAILMRAGIPASRDTDVKTGKQSVWVEPSRFADAVEILQSHGLPRPHLDSIAEVFKGGGLIASPTEERARMVYALGQELSRTIGEIDGVLSARVHIVLPENDPLLRNAPPSSASVMVRTKSDAGVERLIPQIKMLVANSASGLSYDKVSVVMIAAPAPVAVARATPDMADVMGLWVYAESARTLQVVLAGAAALVLALGVLAGSLLWQRRGSARALGTSLVVR